MIISVLNQKGGVGKTTLSIHIASTLALDNNSVLLVDADTQRSALDWAASREGEQLFSVVGIPSPHIHKEVKLLSPRYDYIIIDGPPRVHTVARSIIAASDFIVIPVQPSPYDIWSAEEIVKLIEEVRDTFGDERVVKAAFVINRKIANTVLGREITEFLNAYPFPVLNAVIHQRISFAESASRGSSVMEEDAAGLGALEMKALVEEIIRKVRGQPT